MERTKLKNYTQTSQKWVSAAKYAEIRRKSHFRPTNCDLYHYAGNNPVKYTDPDGKNDFLPIMSPKDFFSFLFKHDSGAKALKVYADAANGDKAAQTVAKEVTVAAGKEMVSATAEAGKKATVVTLDALESTADIVSEVSGDISLVGFATAQPEVAGPFGTIAEGADIVSIGAAGLKAAVSGEKRDADNFFNKAKNFGTSKLFTTALSKSLQKGSNGAVSEFNADAAAAFADKVRSSNEETK